MPRVFITFPIGDQAIEMLRRKKFTVSENSSRRVLSRQELAAAFGEYDGVLTSINDKIDESVINSASEKLKIISNFAVGYDNIDVIAAKRRGIVVTNTPGVAGEAVAEHTFALILAVNKKLIEADKFVRGGKYRFWDPTSFLSSNLWGKTIGIVGLGRIGSFVAQIAHFGLRMKILYHDIAKMEDFELLTEAKFVNLETLLSQSDVVSIHVPLTPGTFHLIGREELALLKETAIIINTARGALIDEKILVECLKNKKIAGAGLDVFENEPNISHELTTLGNVVLTPHSASATVETRSAMAKIAVQNIIDVFEKRTPFGIIKVG